MIGTVGILNVGAGDTKLTFDPNSPQDCIRAARIVKDMLRRGYALLVETTRADGTKVFTRAYDFKEDTYEYIVADFDPTVAAAEDQAEARASVEPPDADTDDSSAGGGGPVVDRAGADLAIGAGDKRGRSGRGKRRRKAVAATGAHAVAVAPSAGG